MATASGVDRTAEVPNMEGGRAGDKTDEREDKEEQEQGKKAAAAAETEQAAAQPTRT